MCLLIADILVIMPLEHCKGCIFQWYKRVLIGEMTLYIIQGLWMSVHWNNCRLQITEFPRCLLVRKSIKFWLVLRSDSCDIDNGSVWNDNAAVLSLLSFCHLKWFPSIWIFSFTLSRVFISHAHLNDINVLFLHSDFQSRPRQILNVIRMDAVVLVS